MLSEIIQALREAEQPLELSKLTKRLETDASALEGMLDQLVKQGKLRRVEDMTVEECQRTYKAGAYGDLCAFLTQGDMATRYDIVES